MISSQRNSIAAYTPAFDARRSSSANRTIPQRLPQPDSGAATIVGPESVETKLAQIWCRILECDRVGDTQDFFQLGGDSFAAVQMMVEVEKEFGQKMSLSTILEKPTFSALAEVIRREQQSGGFSHLVPLQPKGSRLPFFCVHGVGGNVLCFTELARHFAPDHPFYGIQAGGPGIEEARDTSVEAMAARYVRAIRAFQPSGPYHIGGFSFGGSVALEMAQQLVVAGEKVALLAILDHTPPPLRYQRFTWSPSCAVEFIGNASRWFAEDIWRAGRGKRIPALLRKGRKAVKQLTNLFKGASSARTDVEEVFGANKLPEEFRRLMEAHYQALRNYTPSAYAGHTTLFRAKVRPLFRLHGFDLGWTKLATGGVEIISIPGNHETFLKEPNVRTVANGLKDRMRSPL